MPQNRLLKTGVLLEYEYPIQDLEKTKTFS